jgi:HTH-type transcriptional regulator/antitoxin HigA
MIDYAQFRTPGQYIQALLGARDWSQKVLAVVLGADETGINKVLSGKRPLDAEMALALSGIFEVPAENFLTLQKAYDLAQARIVTVADPGLARRANLFGTLPIADMMHRGWLAAANIKDFSAVESALEKFFNVKSIDDIEVFPHAAKRTQVLGGATPTQMAWLYRVREIADEMLTSRFSHETVHEVVAKLRPLLKDKDLVRKVPRILQDYGIRFVIVEALPGSKIDGVCFWLDENKPVIGMSLRFDRIDNFWFVLRHELEHVIRGHGRTDKTVMLDLELDGEKTGTGSSLAEEELMANVAAAEFCVPQKSLNEFIARKAPICADRDISGFAIMCNVHPGLIAGQLRRKLNRYDRFQAHLAKIRSIIAPSALVDGWGNVVQVGS